MTLRITLKIDWELDCVRSCFNCHFELRTHLFEVLTRCRMLLLGNRVRYGVTRIGDIGRRRMLSTDADPKYR